MFRTSYMPAAPVTLAIAAAASVLAALPAAAQDDEGLPFPEGWQVRFDHEGASMDDLYLVTMTPGYHVTTGPAMIAWHPDSVATGDFRIESETFLFDPQGRREAFGFFIGGSGLQGPDQRYTYFLLREGGEFLVKSRAGTATPVVHDWTAHPAIVSYATKPEGSATAKNVLMLEAAGDELRFSVNGELLWTGPRDGLATDGVFGLRVNHGLNLHVTTIMSASVGGGVGPLDIDDIVVPLPRLSPEGIRSIREELELSRAVFASLLRTPVRTLEGWEQGRSKPPPSATALILMARRHPDTFERLASL